MTLQGVVTASVVAERAVDLTLTVLGAAVVGFLVVEALYLAVCVLYLGCGRERRAAPEHRTREARGSG